MRHSKFQRSLLAALLLAMAGPLPARAAAPESPVVRKVDRQADLGQKTDAGGPSQALAGDVTRRKAGEAERPGLQYDTFRFAVELQLKEKRRELMGTLQQMVSIGAEPKEEPDLLFRLGELNWEESRYWFFEANRQEEKALKAKEKGDKAGEAAARSEQKANVQQSETFQAQAIGRYRELIQKHPDYKRVDEVLFYLGHNYWEAGKEKESLAAYKSLITRFPNSRFVPDAYLAFGEWYFNNSGGKRDMLQKALEAYTKAASFTESRVYGFAIYKQGWTLYNLGDYPGAADKFKATVFYGELTQNVAGDNKTALIREARKDYVLAYSHFGDPTQARAAFQQVGGKENWWAMLTSLANLYYDTGKDKEAVLVYRQLIREQPLSPEAPLFQSRIVDAVMRVGNKRITVEQARLLVKIFQDVEKSGVVRDDEGKKKLDQARELSERTLSNLAVVWHNEGKKTRDEETFAFSSEAYGDYLNLFPDSPKAYDLRFFHAELLFENLKKYDWAAAEYERVVAMDVAKIEAAKKLTAEGKQAEAAKLKPGKWMVPALEGAIYAHDEVVKKLGDEPLPAGADPKKPLPIPAPRQALLTACETYLNLVPAGEKRVEIQYKAAQLRYRYNHFDEAVKGFSSIALDHPEHELAVYSAHLVLDTFNILEDYEKIDEWAKRFHAEPKLAKGEFKAELEKIIERNSFKLVALLEKQEKFAQAGDRYVAFVADWPKSDLADEALFNAAVDYAKAGNPEQAIALRERLVREYPKSTLAPEALYRNAVTFEEITDFQKAAEGYERYAFTWEKLNGAPAKAKGKAKRAAAPKQAAAPAAETPKYDQAKAKIALINAGVLRDALGQNRQALKDREKFLELWPRDADAEAVFLSIADLHEKSGNQRLALRQLEAYQKEYGRNIEKNLIALYRMAKLEDARGSRWKRDDRYQEILDQWRRTPKARKAELTRKAGLAVEGVATAHLALSEKEWRDYNRIRIRLPQAAMAQALKEKGQRLLALQKYYTETVSLGVAGPGICALDRIGLAYRGFAQALYDAPVPREFNEEQVSLYKAALAEQATPVEAKAREAFASAVTKSRELGIQNDCTTESLRILEQIASDEFHPLAEKPAKLAVPASAQGLGLLFEEQPIPPPPPADAKIPDVVKQQAPAAPAPAAAPAAARGVRASSTRTTGAVEEAPLPQRGSGEPDDSDLLP